MTARLLEAYVLHTRAFGDTSLIVELLTPEGRMAVLAKGARKQARWKGLLQLFTPLWISFRGKSELPLLTCAEPQSIPLPLLTGTALLSGFYLNELLIRLLEKHDPNPQIFSLYQNLLPCLMKGSLEAALRCFEKNLVKELGYELVLDKELISNMPIAPETYYEYRFFEGAKKIHLLQSTQDHHYIGSSLLALHNEQFDTKESLRDAKRLMRHVLGYLLNDRPLKSRELFF